MVCCRRRSGDGWPRTRAPDTSPGPCAATAPTITRQALTDAITNGKPLDGADSAARVLSHRITRGQDPGHPVPGTESPADLTPAERARLAELHHQAFGRARTLGARAADEVPEWALQHLGPVPDPGDVADRADWERRAGQVAAHREAVGWTHPDQVLGRMPGTTTTERRTSYVTAWHALGRPDQALTEAAMSEGQLRARKRAWDNAQAWAPAKPGRRPTSTPPWATPRTRRPTSPAGRSPGPRREPARGRRTPRRRGRAGHPASSTPHPACPWRTTPCGHGRSPAPASGGPAVPAA
jgi:hypothetical protein